MFYSPLPVFLCFPALFFCARLLMKTIIYLLTNENNCVFGSYWKDCFEMLYIRFRHRQQFITSYQCLLSTTSTTASHQGHILPQFQDPLKIKCPRPVHYSPTESCEDTGCSYSLCWKSIVSPLLFQDVHHFFSVLPPPKLQHGEWPCWQIWRHFPEALCKLAVSSYFRL